LNSEEKGHTVCIRRSIMRHYADRTKYLQAKLFELVLKGQELIVTFMS